MDASEHEDLVIPATASVNTEAEHVDLVMPAATEVRKWGRQYIREMPCMREVFSPHEGLRTAIQLGIMDSTAWSCPPTRNLGRPGATKGPVFVQSFEAIFGVPFWPLTHHLEAMDAMVTSEDETLPHFRMPVLKVARNYTAHRWMTGAMPRTKSRKRVSVLMILLLKSLTVTTAFSMGRTC